MIKFQRQGDIDAKEKTDHFFVSDSDDLGFLGMDCRNPKDRLREHAARLEVEKVQKIMEEKRKELDALKEDLEKRATVMSESARREKEADYQRKLRDVQRMQRDYEEELRRKDRQLTGKILKDLEGIIKKMGEEQKYTVILERNQPTIIYISTALDLTDEVIKLANQKKK